MQQCLVRHDQDLDRGNVDMSGILEIRDKHGDTL